MTRNGKIARLPLAIREELNQRLQNGEQAKDMVVWLNSLPKVQDILKEKFAGQAISENNLSAWRTGGYAVWEQNRSTRESLDLFMEKAADLKEKAGEDLPAGMALFLTAQMAREFNKLDSMAEGEEKTKIRRELLDSLVLLRREGLFAEKLRLERQKFRDYQETERKRREENRRMTPEETQARIRQIMGTE